MTFSRSMSTSLFLWSPNTAFNPASVRISTYLCTTAFLLSAVLLPTTLFPISKWIKKFDIVIVRAYVRPDNTFIINHDCRSQFMSETVTGTSKKEKQQYKKRKIITCHPSPLTSLSGLTTLRGENAVSPGKIFRTNNDTGRKRG